jgi:DNA-binding XRE family transcriptional regulator
VSYFFDIYSGFLHHPIIILSYALETSSVDKEETMKNKLRQIRLKKRLRQCEIAVKAGIPISTMSRIENGWIPANAKQKKALAKVLRVRQSWLFSSPPKTD